MRILFVVHQFLPRHVAGTEIYTFHLAKELQRRGHSVHLFFTEFYEDREQYRLSRGGYEGLPYFEAVHNHYFASFRRTYQDSDMERLFCEVLDEVRPEIVHLQHLHLHSIGYIDILEERDLPVVYTLHEFMLMCLRWGQMLRPGFVICEGPEASECAKCATIYPLPDPAGRPEPREAEQLVHPYLAAVRERARGIRERLDKVDLFVSPSVFLRERFIQVGMLRRERILRSDVGMFVEPFEKVRGHSPRNGRLRVGYVGTISDYKGVHILVEAFQGIDDPAIECAIWGDLKTFPDYTEKLLCMDAPPRLRFMGRFDNGRIAEVLAEIDLLVVPSLWFENSPLVIHEAFLAGVPVLTGDRGGMAELVEGGRSGLHFRIGDSADLRAKILRVAREQGLHERLCAGFPEVRRIVADAALSEARYRTLLAGQLPDR